MLPPPGPLALHRRPQRDGRGGDIDLDVASPIVDVIVAARTNGRIFRLWLGGNVPELLLNRTVEGFKPASYLRDWKVGATLRVGARTVRNSVYLPGGKAGHGLGRGRDQIVSRRGRQDVPEKRQRPKSCQVGAEPDQLTHLGEAG